MNRIFSFIGITLFLLLFVLFPVKIQAQTPYQAQQTTNAFSNIDSDVPQNTHTWTQSVMIETSSALSCLLVGIDMINANQKCLGIDTKTHKIGYVKENGGGAIGAMTTLIAMTYTPPLHTTDYFQHLASNFGIIKPVYAAPPAGIGAQGLLPLLPLWTAFRNIAYLILVLVFLLIGMAIMLRLKIDARTVMSIENQIPKIIIGILLITFSFAIAGFLIDMMYVIIYLVAGVLNTVPGADVGAALGNIQGQNTLEFASSSLGGFGQIANDPAAAVGTVVGSMFGGPLISSVFFALGGSLAWISGVQLAQVFSAGTPIVGSVVGAAIIGTFALLGGIFSTQILGFVVHVLVFLIFAIALLIALFRLWFTLIFAYIYFLLDVILAPFFIIGGIIPGSPINLELWFRDMLANLSVFPVTIAMFLLGKIFMQAFQGSSGTMFVPPLIGNVGSIETLSSIIGFAIILMTPGVVNMMRDLLKAPAFKYAAEAGKSLGAGKGVFSGALGTGMGAVGAWQHGNLPVGGGTAGLGRYVFGKLSGGHG